MFNLVFLFITLCPLIGLILMELGAYGQDAGMFGYPNGASLAYTIHLSVMFGTYAFIWKRYLRKIRRKSPSTAGWRSRGTPSDRVEVLYTRNSFRMLSFAVLAINLGLLVFLLFVMGASDVVRGNLGKGEFRSQLGGYGIFAYSSRDFVVPMLAALLVFTYKRCETGWQERILLWMTLFFTAANGAIWGYNATMISLLIPAFILLMPKLTVIRTGVLISGALVTIVFFTSFYQGHQLSDAREVTLTRATIGTGNSAWRIWDLYQTAPHLFPPYWPTLLHVFGGRLGGELELSLEAGGSFEFVDYTTLMTMLVKNFERSVNVAQSNVTGTVFGEGVIALGSPGFLIFSVLSGAVVGFARILILSGDVRHLPLRASLGATFYMTSVLSWLNAGGITTLFLFPFIVNYAATYFLGYLLLSFAHIPRGHTMRVKTRRVSLRDQASSPVRP